MIPDYPEEAKVPESSGETGDPEMVRESRPGKKKMNAEEIAVKQRCCGRCKESDRKEGKSLPVSAISLLNGAQSIAGNRMLPCGNGDEAAADLQNFGVQVTVTNVSCGPSVTGMNCSGDGSKGQ